MHPILQQNSLCNIPTFFYPTTILLVDDDADFLKHLTASLSEYYKTIGFTEPNAAIKFLMQKSNTHAYRQTLQVNIDKNIVEMRQAVYNQERFKDVVVSVLDEAMPDKSGFDVMKDVDFSDYYQGKQLNHYILLTAKRYTDFDEGRIHEDVAREFISKHSPNYIQDLLKSINQHETIVFQHDSYEAAITLAKINNNRTIILNNGNFLPIFNEQIKKHDICEWYLLDKLGSLMLLDMDANLSYFFVRDEKGMQHSINYAKQHHAPDSIIKALESREFILSLYEEADFARLNKIDWEQYLLKAEFFTDKGKKLEFCNDCPTDYYYAFTNNFAAHGLDKNKIYSYRQFLQGE